MPTLPVTPHWLKATVPFPKPEGVDREAQILRGYVVAQEGPFKTPGRGEFDVPALQTIVHMINARSKGLKVRFGHPTLSDDGLGKYLGRSREARLASVSVEHAGSWQEITAVRANLHFNQTAQRTPNGDLVSYIMDLAASDADALSSSLVLEADKEMRRDARGQPLRDAMGEELPPLWRPTRLHASDIVDTGEAVDGLLSVHWPDAVVRQGCELLDKAFKDQPREVVMARCLSWLQRYLELRYGPPPKAPETPALDKWRARFQQRVALLTALRPKAK